MRLSTMPEPMPDIKIRSLDGSYCPIEFGGINEQTRGCILQDIQQFRRSQTEVKRHHDGARLGTGKKNIEELTGIDHQDSDPLAFDGTQSRQGMGSLVHPFIESTVVKLAIILFQERPFRIIPGPFENPLANIHTSSPV
jgi:hypothetical protein